MSAAGIVIHRNWGQGCGRGEGTNRLSSDSPSSFANRGPRHFGHNASAAAALARAFDEIGWTGRQAERRSGVSRHRIARWLEGQPADPRFLDWIDELASLHRRFPHPLARGIVPGNRPVMDGRAVGMALLTIGWSERRFAERVCEHRTTVRRALAGRASLMPRQSRWLELLADGHLMHPQPVQSPPVRFLAGACP